MSALVDEPAQPTAALLDHSDAHLASDVDVPAVPGDVLIAQKPLVAEDVAVHHENGVADVVVEDLGVEKSVELANGAIEHNGVAEPATAAPAAEVRSFISHDCETRGDIFALSIQDVEDEVIEAAAASEEVEEVPAPAEESGTCARACASVC